MIKEKNKVNLQAEILTKTGHRIGHFHVSDGKTVALNPPGAMLKEELSEDSRESFSFKAALARAGITLSSVTRNRDHERVHGPVERRFIIGGLNLGQEEAGLRPLSYVFKCAPHERVYETTIWYRPSDYKVLKRMTLVKEPDFEESFTELYEELLTSDRPHT